MQVPNLFFNNSKQRHPLIGDFGISSYLEKSVNIHHTQTAANLTLDYAAPELLDGHEVSAKTDYYSLGITLLHLLRGRSPFYGLNKNDVLVSHLRGRVSLPDNLSLDFHQLLRGLTLPNSEDRWGYNEVLGWLRGEHVALHLDSLQNADPNKGTKPYPGYPQVRTAQALASSLDRFDAFKQLQRGDIRRWIFDNINQNLAEEIEACFEGIAGVAGYSVHAIMLKHKTFPLQILILF
ncbi:MAG: protein kinase [Methylococcales bacterium]|nr:protein kinase [Methylococcales bacterium]